MLWGQGEEGAFLTLGHEKEQMNDRYIRDAACPHCLALVDTADARAPPANRLLRRGWGGAGLPA